MTKDSDKLASGEGNNPKESATQFLAVALSYDEKTKMLSAVLTPTPVDPQIDYPSLLELIKDKGYESFKVPGPAVENVLRKIRSGEAGAIELGKKPEYTTIEFVYDEKTRLLTAELSEAEEDPKVTWASLQEVIRENNYQAFQIQGALLQSLLKRAAANERGSFPVGEKPEYTLFEFVYDEKTRVLSTVLTASEEDPKITLLSLQEMIKEKGYESYLPKGNELENLQNRLKNKERGAFPLGEKPEYTLLGFEYDEETRGLSAVLTATDDDPKITQSSLQKMIEEKGYQTYLPKGTEINDLYKRITSKERGTFVIGEKPEYTQITLTFDEENDCLNATLAATDNDPRIALKSLQDMVSSMKFDKLFFEQDALTQLFKRISAKERGVFAIAKRKDAEVTISLSNDEMKAFITSSIAYGGKDLAELQITVAVNNANIKPAFCDQSVLATVLESPSVNDLLFAKGKAAEDGIDTKFRALVEEVIYHKPTVDKKSDKADLHEIQDFSTVDVGDQVMQRIPATTGIDGSTVTGKVLHGVPGKDTPFATETLGVIVDPSDSNLLIADAKGHPVIMRDGVRVDKTMKVTNVDLNTGNITLDGSLLVADEIKANMEVHVTGDVIVKGIIASAKVTAGNDITIDGGVIGSEKMTSHEPLSAVLIAKGNIKANFASLAVLKAGKNIEVAEYIAHCEVAAKEKVLVGQAGGKGRLFGGYCHAEDGVVANVVGTDADIKTLVSAGYASELQKNIDQLKEEKSASVKQAEQLTAVFKKYMEQHKKQSLDSKELEKAKMIRSTVISLKDRIKEISTELKEIKIEMKSTKKSDITIQKAIYPNVTITVNGLDFSIRKQSKGGCFMRNGDDMKWEPV